MWDPKGLRGTPHALHMPHTDFPHSWLSPLLALSPFFPFLLLSSPSFPFPASSRLSYRPVPPLHTHTHTHFTPPCRYHELEGGNAMWALEAMTGDHVSKFRHDHGDG